MQILRTQLRKNIIIRRPFNGSLKKKKKTRVELNFSESHLWNRGFQIWTTGETLLHKRFKLWKLPPASEDCVKKTTKFWEPKVMKNTRNQQSVQDDGKRKTKVKRQNFLELGTDQWSRSRVNKVCNNVVEFGDVMRTVMFLQIVRKSEMAPMKPCTVYIEREGHQVLYCLSINHLQQR